MICLFSDGLARDLTNPKSVWFCSATMTSKGENFCLTLLQFNLSRKRYAKFPIILKDLHHLKHQHVD